MGCGSALGGQGLPGGGSTLGCWSCWTRSCCSNVEPCPAQGRWASGSHGHAEMCTRTMENFTPTARESPAHPDFWDSCTYHSPPRHAHYYEKDPAAPSRGPQVRLGKTAGCVCLASSWKTEQQASGEVCEGARRYCTQVPVRGQCQDACQLQGERPVTLGPAPQGPKTSVQASECFKITPSLQKQFLEY